MKKVLLTVAVLGTIFLSGCEKDEAVSPADRSSIKADDVIMCAGCGQWDIDNPDPEASSSRVAAPLTDTVSTPKRPGKPGKKK
jgi:nitrous oxide reductase accessory protein NosL